MKTGRKFLAIMLTVIFTVTFMPTGVFNANYGITVTINDAPIIFEGQQPVIRDGRTLVPVRGVFEQIGFEVSWNNAAQQATLSNGRQTFILTIGSRNFTVNGMQSHRVLEVPAQIIGGSTMLPLRPLIESIGLHLQWDAATRTIHIGGWSAAEGFPGRVAIVTNPVEQNEEEYRSAEALVARFGEDMIIHRTWPTMFAQEGETMIRILEEIASDPAVRVLVINQAVINTNAAVDRVREMRGDDIFIVYAQPAEDPIDVAVRANLLFNTNDPVIGYKLVHQAIAMGAETIAHYSFPRHMSVPLLAMRRDIMRETAMANGLMFVELAAPDPMGNGGMPATQMHIMQDLRRQVETFGENTAFFGTNCGMMIPMIEQVISTGAIFPSPCCPSPYHGFPTALDLASRVPTGEYDEWNDPIMRMRALPEVIDEIRSEIARRGASGRLATWPVSAGMLWTHAGVMYGIEWMNGNVPTEVGVIDMNVLENIMMNYIEEISGQRLGVDLEPLNFQGQLIRHYILGVMDYLVF
ncbi:MAG: DUF3798 domain-containing protein [Defluviitaleaceae bacterium]|nr:DUF3798 domain-containing protein [Defluviitaleaceae bacterium]